MHHTLFEDSFEHFRSLRFCVEGNIQKRRFGLDKNQRKIRKLLYRHRKQETINCLPEALPAG